MATAATTATPPKISMDSLLGPRLLTKVGGPQKPTAEVLKDKAFVLLYFSASWCPPCKAFTPILVDFYKEIAAAGKLEIIYVSSDRTVGDFEGYYEKMPWLSVSNDPGSATVKNNLAQKLGIAGIPTLMVLDAKTGELISAKARDEVMAAMRNGSAKSLVDEWKAAERVPLSEAPKALQAASGPNNPLMAILMWFAKNPMAIFALLYLYKYLKKKYGASVGIEDEAVEETEDVVAPATGEGDSEF